MRRFRLFLTCQRVNSRTNLHWVRGSGLVEGGSSSYFFYCSKVFLAYPLKCLALSEVEYHWYISLHRLPTGHSGVRGLLDVLCRNCYRASSRNSSLCQMIPLIKISLQSSSYILNDFRRFVCFLTILDLSFSSCLRTLRTHVAQFRMRAKSLILACFHIHNGLNISRLYSVV
jgi:hypothetical protein